MCFMVKFNLTSRKHVRCASIGDWFAKVGNSKEEKLLSLRNRNGSGGQTVSANQMISLLTQLSNKPIYVYVTRCNVAVQKLISIRSCKKTEDSIRNGKRVFQNNLWTQLEAPCLDWYTKKYNWTDRPGCLEKSNVGKGERKGKRTTISSGWIQFQWQWVQLQKIKWAKWEMDHAREVLSMRLLRVNTNLMAHKQNNKN